MFSKNFIFTSLFFVMVLFCLSCYENKKENTPKQLYSILPTDSSNFTNSLDEIEIIKTSEFNLDGKWTFYRDSTLENKNLYMIFEGRKIYSNFSDNKNQSQNEIRYKEDYQTFAFYDTCPDEGGRYNKNGKFLVIGSGNEECTCYEIVNFSSQGMLLYDVDKGGELKFSKVK